MLLTLFQRENGWKQSPVKWLFDALFHALNLQIGKVENHCNNTNQTIKRNQFWLKIAVFQYITINYGKRLNIIRAHSKWLSGSQNALTKKVKRMLWSRFTNFWHLEGCIFIVLREVFAYFSSSFMLIAKSNCLDIFSGLWSKKTIDSCSLFVRLSRLDGFYGLQ